MEQQILKQLKWLKGEDQKLVLELGKKYSRSIQTKLVKTQPIEHSHACLDLALDQQGIEVEKELLQRLSGTTRSRYYNTKSQYRMLLGLQHCDNLLPGLVSKYAPSLSRALLRKIESLLQCFRERLLNTLTLEQKKKADFSRSVFIVVAFWLVVRQEHIKIPKSDLIADYILKQQDFDNVQQQMQQLCSDILPTSTKKLSKRNIAERNGISLINNGRKRIKLENVGHDVEQENGGGDDEKLPNHCINRQAVKQLKFEKWKEDTIQECLKQQETRLRKKRQPCITQFMKPREEIEVSDDETSQ